MNLLVGFVVSLAFGLLAYGLKSVSASGLWSGVAVGTLLYSFSGPQGFSCLAFFFILASLFTRLGQRRKREKGVAQPNEGRRRAREALANCLPGLLFAFLGWRNESELFQVGFVASFASALADTTATELGQLYGRRFFRIPSFLEVPVGTRGGCSREGTLSGILAASAMALVGWGVGLIPSFAIPWVVVGATIGFIGESLVSRILINHEARNFIGTSLGGISGMIFSSLLS